MGFVEIIKIIFEVMLAGAFALSLIYFVITMFAMLNSRRQAANEPSIDPAYFPYITVQIPTYNEAAALNCAKRCLRFDYPKNKIQIIIGDDSDNKNTSALIDQFAAQHSQIEVNRRGCNKGFKPGNLNAMLPKSRGEYLLILDSDFLPKRDFLRKIVTPVIENPDLAGVQAGWKIMNIHHNLNTLLGGSIVNVVHAILMPFMHKVTGHAIFCGSGELIRKKDLIDLGGWKEGSLTEDVDYSLRLIAIGKRIAYINQLRIRCEAPYTAHDLFRQQMRWAYGVVKSFLEHGKKILYSKITQTNVKLATFVFASGYVMITLLLFTFIFGMLNIICGMLGFNPAESASSTYTVARWVHDSALNLMLTGGMILSTIMAGFINGFSIKSLGKLFFALLTIGFVCMFFVGRGVFSACVGLPMHWFMLKKAGNERQI